MERYESLGLVGEGSYGTVLKCRHRDSGRLVAIKKFMDSDDDKTVKKIALREIKLLRQLRHDNLVNLLEVWKRRRRWYLVFEFVERTLLDDLEQNASGLDLNTGRQYLYQILRAAAFCHQQNIIHRDIKPENILISQGGVVKLCDFGFARTMTSPAEGGVYTDYVATRWYRAPELLVGDTKYGKPVDVWAVGCLLLEMLTGQPLFPGDSDLDQIYHIVRCFGNLTANHQEMFYRNPVFSGVRLPECSGRVPMEQRFPTITPTVLDLAQSCLQMDPERRAQCSELLEHPLFTQDSFHIRILDELNVKIQKDHRENSTLPKIAKTPRREKDEGDEKNRRGKDKKQSEDMVEKVNKEKEKRDKDCGEEKTAKTKGKQPLKPFKTIRNTSELLISTKQSKTFGAKVIDNVAKTTVSMKSKPGKATGAELRKEPEISKLTKTPTSDSLEASNTATDRKDTLVAKTKSKVIAPEPRGGHLKNTDTNNRESSGMCSSCSQHVMSSVTEKNVMETWRSPKNEPRPGFVKSHPNGSSSPQDYLKSTIDHAEVMDTNLTQKMGTISNTEYPEGAATAVKISNQAETSLTLKASQSLSNDHIGVAITTIPSVTKPRKTSTISEHQTDCSTTDAEQRRTFECPPRGFPTDGEITDVSIATKTLQDSCNISNKEIEEHHRCLKMSPATKTAANHIVISDASGEDYKENPESSEPCTIHQQSTSQSKITAESRTTSTLMPNEVPKTNTSVGTTIPKTLKVSDKENRDNLELSVSISVTTKSSANQISKVSRSSNIEQKNNSSEAEPNIKSLKPPHSKSLFGEPKTKHGSLNNHTNKSITTVTLKTQKTTFPTEVRKKRENPERNDTTNISTIADSISFTSTTTPDHEASTRDSVFHNMDTADVKEFDFCVPHSSPPPPPPPPSSTPLLIPPSSTPLIPSSSVISTSSPASSDHHTLGAGFHPRTHSLRSIDKPRHHGGIYSRLAQQPLSSHITRSPTAQASEKSLTCERSFLSDRGGITVTKKKTNIHFPDLRSSVLPELRGREGKHNKGTSKDQRKQPVPSIPPSVSQQHRHNNTNTQTP